MESVVVGKRKSNTRFGTHNTPAGKATGGTGNKLLVKMDASAAFQSTLEEEVEESSSMAVAMSGNSVNAQSRFLCIFYNVTRQETRIIDRTLR